MAVADRTSSGREYLAILKRSFAEFKEDNLTSVAAALAYYGFLAIPSVLLVVVGVFGLVSDPGGAESLVNRLDNVMPEQARSLLQDSLSQLTGKTGTSLTILLVGIGLALWSLTGA